MSTSNTRLHSHLPWIEGSSFFVIYYGLSPEDADLVLNGVDEVGDQGEDDEEDDDDDRYRDIFLNHSRNSPQQAPLGAGTECEKSRSGRVPSDCSVLEKVA